MSNTEKFYCPQCGKKQLIAEHRWSNGGYRKIWECQYNKEPKTWRGRRNWDKSKKPCGLVIEVEGRDATIDDYDDVLKKLARINVPQIEQWVLGNDNNVHKKGLETLYEGNNLDLVRRVDGQGLGVEIYWRGRTWEPETGLDPWSSNYYCLRHEAAQFVSYKHTTVAKIFGDNTRLVLWRKSDADGGDTGPFDIKGLGKKAIKKLVDFARGLDEDFREIVERTTTEVERWRREETEVKQIIEPYTQCGDMRLLHYSGELRTSHVWVRQCTVSEVGRINEALGLDIKLGLQTGSVGVHLNVDEMGRVLDVLGQRLTAKFHVEQAFRNRRLTNDEIKLVIGALR